MGRVVSSFRPVVYGNACGMGNSNAVEVFYSKLSQGLDNLERLLSSDFITLEWLSYGVEFLKSTHSGLVLLIEKLQLPISRPCEGWVAEYMDETVKLLDVCNVLKVGVKGMEHYQMLVEAVAAALRRMGGVGRAVRGIDALDTCKEEVERLQTENKNLVESKIEADGRLYFNLNDKHAESKFVIWNGLWGVMFAVKNVSSFVSWMLLWGLVYAGNSSSLKFEMVSFGSPWCASFVRLQQRVHEAISKIQGANNDPAAFVHEFDSLQRLLRDIREQLRPINRHAFLDSAESSKAKQAVHQLGQRSLNFKGGLDILDWLLNDLFDDIVEGRNKLLQNLSN
eukprot:c19504_g1_i1 orf=314-1327(-)